MSYRDDRVVLRERVEELEKELDDKSRALAEAEQRLEQAERGLEQAERELVRRSSDWRSVLRGNLLAAVLAIGAIAAAITFFMRAPPRAGELVPTPARPATPPEKAPEPPATSALIFPARLLEAEGFDALHVGMSCEVQVWLGREQGQVFLRHQVDVDCQGQPLHSGRAPVVEGARQSYCAFVDRSDGGAALPVECADVTVPREGAPRMRLDGRKGEIEVIASLEPKRRALLALQEAQLEPADLRRSIPRLAARYRVERQTPPSDALHAAPAHTNCAIAVQPTGAEPRCSLGVICSEQVVVGESGSGIQGACQVDASGAVTVFISDSGMTKLTASPDLARVVLELSRDDRLELVLSPSRKRPAEVKPRR